MAGVQKDRSQKLAPVPDNAGAAHKVEWATGIVSGIVVALMIGWVAWEALMATETPPVFAITMTDRSEVEGGYRVMFDIANTSSQTAAAVVVRGEIIEENRAVEDADVTFDYVPGASKASGTIFFSENPGTRSVRLRAVGYTEP